MKSKNEHLIGLLTHDRVKELVTYNPDNGIVV